MTPATVLIGRSIRSAPGQSVRPTNNKPWILQFADFSQNRYLSTQADNDMVHLYLFSSCLLRYSSLRSRVDVQADMRISRM